MFQNAYQSGTHLEIFDPKCIISNQKHFKEAMNKANKEKDRAYSQLYKINIPRNVQKVYDKDMRGYIFEIEGHSTKLQFPRQGDLCLVQQYLVVQLYLYQGYHWGIELVITDTSKTKRRIMLTSSVRSLEQKFFHLKSPIDQIRRDVWLNLQIDIWSFMEGWKGCTFRSLDMIIISAPCKLRKVFITKNPIEDSEMNDMDMKFGFLQIPLSVDYPESFPHSNQVVTYKLLNYNMLDQLKQYRTQFNMLISESFFGPKQKEKSLSPQAKQQQQKKLGAYQYQNPQDKLKPVKEAPVKLNEQIYEDEAFYEDEGYEEEVYIQYLKNIKGLQQITEDIQTQMHPMNQQGQQASYEKYDYQDQFAIEQNEEALESKNQVEYIMKFEREYTNQSDMIRNRSEDQFDLTKSEENPFQKSKIQQKDKQEEYDSIENWENDLLNEDESQDQLEDQQDEQMINVVYDPVLNCFFDPVSNQYYQLK